MKWVFQPTILSQMGLAWQRLAVAAAAMVAGLGLGLTGRKPFLLRPERARLALQLGLSEALLRRLLLLEAARLGPLALKPRKAGPPAAPPARSAPVRTPKAPRAPALRLFERAPKGRAAATNPPPRFIPGPRILFLDAPLPPPEPGEYPARSDDLVPAGRLITRLHAVAHALKAPAPLDGHWLAPHARTGPAARALRDLHAHASLIDAALNSS